LLDWSGKALVLAEPEFLSQTLTLAQVMLRRNATDALKQLYHQL
jgi:hypothetical protein